MHWSLVVTAGPACGRVTAMEAQMINRADPGSPCGRRGVWARFIHIQRCGLLCAPSNLDFSTAFSRRHRRSAATALLNWRRTGDELLRLIGNITAERMRNPSSFCLHGSESPAGHG